MIKIRDNYIADDVQDIICELKRQLELKGIKRFYKITDTPNNVMVCCPFHKEGQERKPSMGILKTDGTCHCFACGWVGSLAEMISGCFGYDDWGKYGEQWLVKNFLAIEVENRPSIDLDLSRKKPMKNKVEYVREKELDSYRYIHPYMYERKLTDEIIELFDIGYDSSTDCITFPIRDICGNCLFIARRSVKTKYFHYPQGVEKPLYGLYEVFYVGDSYSTWHDIYGIERADEVVVCESMIDALTCWVYGKFAVALNGLGNNLQFEQLRKLKVRKLILATDNDEAGMKARQRIAKNVTNKILTQYIIPEGKKDINDLTLEEFLSLNENFL